jgi:hypothetical protein
VGSLRASCGLGDISPLLVVSEAVVEPVGRAKGIPEPAVRYGPCQVHSQRMPSPSTSIQATSWSDTSACVDQAARRRSPSCCPTSRRRSQAARRRYRSGFLPSLLARQRRLDWASPLVDVERQHHPAEFDAATRLAPSTVVIRFRTWLLGSPAARYAPLAAWMTPRGPPTVREPWRSPVACERPLQQYDLLLSVPVSSIHGMLDQFANRMRGHGLRELGSAAAANVAAAADSSSTWLLPSPIAAGALRPAA